MTDPTWLRLGFFVGIFLLCSLWESKLPRKSLTLPKFFRWRHNLSLVVLNSVVVTLALPIAAFQAANIALTNEWGLMNWLSFPLWLNIMLTIVLMDFIIYVQHLAFHWFKPLWRLHRVHHADLDIDVTTGIRFHPIEIFLSMLIKLGAIFILGVHPLSIVIFEILLNGSAMFNHSNGKLPLWLDKWVRKLVVTPDMHRVHHSNIVKETHSNFGFFLSIWDRGFNTYIDQPKLGHSKVKIGVPEFTHAEEQRVDKLLTQPFRNREKPHK